MRDLPFPHDKERLLAPLTTLGIGGAATYFTQVTHKDQLKPLLLFCKENQLPFFILGKGSNTLFEDCGFRGLVIHNKIDLFAREGTRVTVGAGFSFSHLGTLTARAGLSGLEFAAAIPATVGGAIYMNAGASGQETWQTLESIDFMDAGGEESCLRASSLKYGYRNSSFQKMRGVILSGTFQLVLSSEARSVQKKLIDYRIKSQPYKDKSAGSIFRNPSAAKSAGALIEQCQLKGLSVGGAMVSLQHANFIINKGHATAQDILTLIAHIKKIVWEREGILLEEEVRFIENE